MNYIIGNFTKNIDNYLLYLFILILPISLFYPATLSINVVILIFLIKIIKAAIAGKFTFFTGSFDIPIVFVSISYLISTFFVTPSQMNAFLLPGTVTVILIGTFIYFFTNQLSLDGRKHLTNLLFVNAVFFSILILLSLTKTISWFTPEGGYFSSTLYLTTLIPIMISTIFRQKEFAYKFLITISLFITLFALTISVITILPQKEMSPRYPSLKTSYSVLVGSLKENPLLGIGSANYLEGFNKYRPFEYNKSELWANKFNQGSSFIITNLTETGILGSLAFISLIIIFVKNMLDTVRDRRKVGWGLIASLDFLSTTFAFILLTVFPSFPILIFVLFILLGITSETKRHESIIPSKVAWVFISIPLLILISFLTYKVYKVAFAEYSYLKGVRSLSNNNAKDSYLNLKRAINLNPGVDRYHKVLSSVNFAIANSITQKEGITEKEKEQSTLFVQEAINEAKAMVALNNKSSENWEFLGKTYYLLIPVAAGADQFAIDSYKQAIALDPINPNLRIELGKVYMVQKKYVEAIETFKLAVLAKDDHPNAHYNLALAYKGKGEIDNAKMELNKTLLLLKSNNSKDYDVAKKELDTVDIPFTNPEPTPATIESPVATSSSTPMSSPAVINSPTPTSTASTSGELSE